MSTFCYNKGVMEIVDGTIDPDNDTLKIMLVAAGYVQDPDDDVVDAGGANDAVDHEVTCTNYTKGWGGAGRKTASIAISEDDSNNRVILTITDLTWSSIGGAVNDTIAGAILVKEGGADDTTSRLIAYFDVTNTPTNGGDITLDFATAGAGGNIRFNNTLT